MPGYGDAKFDINSTALAIGSGDSSGADGYAKVFGGLAQVTYLVAVIKEAVTGGTAVITARRQTTPTSTSGQKTIGTFTIGTAHTAGSRVLVPVADWGDTTFGPGESILLEVTTLDSGSAGDVHLGIVYWEEPSGDVSSGTLATSGLDKLAVDDPDGKLFVLSGTES